MKQNRRLCHFVHRLAININMADLVQHALDFATKTTWDSIPADVQHQSKRSLLDAMGCLLAGTQTPVADIMSDFAEEECPGNKATILVSGKKASFIGAVLANGFASNAFDIDDGHWKTKGHPGAVIFPSLVTLSEMPGAKKTGKDFLTALVVGNELAVRAGDIRHKTYTQVYHSSGSWSPLGVAGAAGNLLGLDQQVIWHAMGAGEYHAALAPMMKGIAVSSMTKDSMGWGAMVGIASVLMAQKGFTGIQPLFADAPDPDIVKNLGTYWELMEFYYKPYAACRWAHPPIAGALKIFQQMQEKRIPVEAIEKIHILTFKYANAMRTTHPQDTEEAQYNIAYPVAAALYDGELGPKQVLPPRIFDENVLRLTDKVEVGFDPWMEEMYLIGRKFADVTVTTKDGVVFNSGKTEPKWDKLNLPSDKELEEKFRWLVEPVLGKDRVDKLTEMVWNFENVQNVAELIQLCIK